MAENNINAFCAICGKGYHVCRSCKEQEVFKPWRTITDTVDHYKIYLAIHGYTISKEKETAKKELQNCNLDDSGKFKPEIKAVIKEIMFEQKKTKNTAKKKENLIEDKSETENKTNDINE